MAIYMPPGRIIDFHTSGWKAPQCRHDDLGQD